MTITRLTLKNYRNYPELRLEAGSEFIILSGENGAGKTNILEAVSLLAPGRGLRRATSGRYRPRYNGPGDFAVAADMGDIQLGTGTSLGTTRTTQDPHQRSRSTHKRPCAMAVHSLANPCNGSTVHGRRFGKTKLSRPAGHCTGSGPCPQRCAL